MTDSNRIFIGTRQRDGGTAKTTVSVVEGGEARPLPLRLDLKDYSPSGFEWGYGNNGQLGNGQTKSTTSPVKVVAN